jgi:hypothetical protein
LIREGKRSFPDRAYLLGSLFLVAPIHLVGVLVATDTPLILFGALASLVFLRADREDRPDLAVGAGSLLGLAFLSKYLAVLGPLAWVAWALKSGHSKRTLKLAAVACVAVLPFAALHIAWSWGHCWPSLMFNLNTRHAGGETSHLATLGQYLAFQIYLATPFLLFALFQSRAGWAQALKKTKLQAAPWFFGVPIAVFALSAWSTPQSMHWTLSFYPLYYLAVGGLLARPKLLTQLKIMGWFSAVHLLFIGTFLAVPLSAHQGKGYYRGLVMFFRIDELVEKARPKWKDRVVAADGYTLASLISSRTAEHVVVFGEGSRFGREDDLVTDFRPLDGRDFAIHSHHDRPVRDFAPYFDSVDLVDVSVAGVAFHVYVGHHFKYDIYRGRVLRPILEHYYSLPERLGGLADAYAACPCPFRTRYFPVGR